ncbi:MAG TPA: hypothetical protein VEF55_04520 [Candidatus Binatia bacterium]|nr:hypothetical protein [Candidatus Binatia bacterium]
MDPFTFYFWRRRLVKRGALAPEDAPAARDSGGAGAAPASRDVSCVGVAGQAESQRSAAAQALFAEVALPAFDEPAAARAESIPGACAPGGDARACDGAAGTGIAGREVPEPDALDLAGAAATQPFEIVYPQGLVVRVPPVFDAEALSRVLACVLSYAMAYGDVSGACLPGGSGSVPALSAGSAREAR